MIKWKHDGSLGTILEMWPHETDTEKQMIIIIIIIQIQSERLGFGSVVNNKMKCILGKEARSAWRGKRMWESANGDNVGASEILYTLNDRDRQTTNAM